MDIPVVSLEQVAKVYRSSDVSVEALRGIDLRIRECKADEFFTGRRSMRRHDLQPGKNEQNYTEVSFHKLLRELHGI